MSFTIRRKKWAGGLICLVCLAAIGCGSSAGNKDTTTEGADNDAPSEKESDVSIVTETSANPAPTTCATDADCVKETCCHAKACVLASQGPSCDEIMCSQDCQEGTMDCGKGACACQDGACIVKWQE